jgi:hypothetical protein
MQNEDAEQTPPEQSNEQQSVLSMHVLPSVLHVAFSGVQVPFEHWPLQHAPFAAHAWLSLTHDGRLQTPPVHVSEQQSDAFVQPAPTSRQMPAPEVPKPVAAVEVAELAPPMPVDVLRPELAEFDAAAPTPVLDVAPVPVPVVEPLSSEQPKGAKATMANPARVRSRSRSSTFIVCSLPRSGEPPFQCREGDATARFSWGDVCSPRAHANGMTFALTHSLTDPS